jgi:damage-control phosphatase, subfamily I
MNTYLDCVPCFLRQSLEAARNVTEDTRIHEQIVRDVLRMTAELDLNQPPPFVGQAIHRRLRELTGVKDPYQAAKRRFNSLAMEALPELAELVRQAEDPLLAAATCSVAANAIDMGIASAITEAEVRAALRGLPEAPVHGDWEGFLEVAAKATDILYLADNAGEIAVDRLVIEALGAERVTVAVRGAPVLNDATVADAHEVGMDELVRVIDNGSDAPGTILDDCCSSFRKLFDQADLIIAKGQGNFESLSGTGTNIAFWFKVKCPVVGSQVGLAVGTLALLAPTGLRCSHVVAAHQGGRP